MRGRDLGVSLTTKFSVAEIVRDEKDDVGLFSRVSGGSEKNPEQKTRDRGEEESLAKLVIGWSVSWGGDSGFD